MKVAVVANTTWYLLNFRLNLMVALRDAGHEVVAIGGPDDYAAGLRAAGFEPLGVPFTGAGMHPLRELRTMLALRRALATERVDLVLSYTPKGNIYSALALLARPARLIANVSGLGRAFITRGWLTTFVKLLYALTLRRASIVFFQNQDDFDLFRAEGLVRSDRARRVPGSGVDLRRFTPAPLPDDSQGLVFLMVARLIWEKGLAEFVQAARLATEADPRLRFVVLGALDPATGRGPSLAEVQGWSEQGSVEYMGATDDVRPALAGAHCVVLPSYREGVPRSLLEAAAMGRPIIATDTAGCRDAVEPGGNGFLCAPRDGVDLARQCLRFAGLTRDERACMGERSRQRAERLFDEKEVIARYLEAARELSC